MISSVQNPTIKALLKLKQKKYRQEERAFLVEGEHLVSEALRFGRVKSILYTARYHGKIDLKESLKSVNMCLKNWLFPRILSQSWQFARCISPNWISIRPNGCCY